MSICRCFFKLQRTKCNHCQV